MVTQVMMASRSRKTLVIPLARPSVCGNYIMALTRITGTNDRRSFDLNPEEESDIQTFNAHSFDGLAPSVSHTFWAHPYLLYQQISHVFAYNNELYLSTDRTNWYRSSLTWFPWKYFPKC